MTDLQNEATAQALIATTKLFANCVEAVAALTPIEADRVLLDALHGHPYGRALRRLIEKSAAPLRAQRVRRERPPARAA